MNPGPPMNHRLRSLVQTFPEASHHSGGPMHSVVVGGLAHGRSCGSQIQRDVPVRDDRLGVPSGSTLLTMDARAVCLNTLVEQVYSGAEPAGELKMDVEGAENAPLRTTLRGQIRCGAFQSSCTEVTRPLSVRGTFKAWDSRTKCHPAHGACLVGIRQ